MPIFLQTTLFELDIIGLTISDKVAATKFVQYISSAKPARRYETLHLIQLQFLSSAIIYEEILLKDKFYQSTSTSDHDD